MDTTITTKIRFITRKYFTHPISQTHEALVHSSHIATTTNLLTHSLSLQTHTRIYRAKRTRRNEFSPVSRIGIGIEQFHGSWPDIE